MRGDLVLIVDNDSELRRVLSEGLFEAGFRVACAANGLQAIHAIAREQPAVVLLDMHMPMLDGVGFVQRLAEFGRQATIIVMSGFPISHDQLERMGARAFIAKPFDLDEVVGRIRRLPPEAAAA